MSNGMHVPESDGSLSYDLKSTSQLKGEFTSLPSCEWLWAQESLGDFRGRTAGAQGQERREKDIEMLSPCLSPCSPF